MWNRWGGGRVFSQRDLGSGACGAGVILRNINVEDPRPTLQVFMLTTEMPEKYGKGGRGPGDMAGVLFQNISIAALSVLEEPEIIWGKEGARIHHLTFDNLTLGDKRIESAEFFKTNVHVSDLLFVKKAR
jgi:hypothetical protein